MVYFDLLSIILVYLTIPYLCWIVIYRHSLHHLCQTKYCVSYPTRLTLNFHIHWLNVILRNSDPNHYSLWWICMFYVVCNDFIYLWNQLYCFYFVRYKITVKVRSDRFKFKRTLVIMTFLFNTWSKTLKTVTWKNKVNQRILGRYDF